MNKVVVVHFLGVDDVTVLFLAQVGGVDAVGTQEFSVGHAEGLTDGLCDELCLRGGKGSVGGQLLSTKAIPVDNSKGVRKITVIAMNREQQKNVKTKHVYKGNI